MVLKQGEQAGRLNGVSFVRFGVPTVSLVSPRIDAYELRPVLKGPACMHGQSTPNQVPTRHSRTAASYLTFQL